MAPTRKVVNYGPSAPSGPKPKKRKAGKIGPRSLVKSKKVDKQIGQSATLAKHKKLKDKIKEVKKGKVKVPKLLRKQVTQILDAKDVYGTAELQCFGMAQDLNTTSYTNQKVFALPLPRIGNIQQAGLLFDPFFWQYVLARLFNGRPDQGTGLSTGAWSNLLIQENQAAPYFWANFDQINDANTQGTIPITKFSVQKVYAKITMKNNTTRTMHLKMYVCKPKYPRRDVSGVPVGTPGVAVSDWKDALESEAAAKGQDGNGFQSVANLKSVAINVSGSVTPETMYAKPTQCQTWNRLYHVEEFAITLEPGQVHHHTVNGDAIDIDFSKMYVPDGLLTLFNRIQKFNRYVFFTGVQELAYDSVQGGIRANNNTITQGETQIQAQYLLFETRIFAKVKMPENTGGSIDVQGTYKTFTTNNRKRAYFVDKFTNSPSITNDGFEMNVDDNTTTQQTR